MEPESTEERFKVADTFELTSKAAKSFVPHVLQPDLNLNTESRVASRLLVPKARPETQLQFRMTSSVCLLSWVIHE